MHPSAVLHEDSNYIQILRGNLDEKIGVQAL
jgi:hypothetical protein